MTAPSIKEALEQCRNYIASNLRMSSDADERIRRDRLIERANAALATFQPSGERREAIARIIDPTVFDVDWMHRDDKRYVEALAKADQIIASGFVQNEAGIRRDEREKCAAEVEGRNWPCVGDARRIAAAIRSARDGGE